MVAQYRRDILTSNEVYHVYTRSIAKFVVFNNCVEYERIIDLIRYYQFDTIQYRYSDYIDLPHDLKRIVLDKMAIMKNSIIATGVSWLVPLPIYKKIESKELTIQDGDKEKIESFYLGEEDKNKIPCGRDHRVFAIL